MDYKMISLHSLLVCIFLVFVQACAQDSRVVRELQFSRTAPAWRSNTRVRQIQGNFPMAFFDSGSRPRLFSRWARHVDYE